MKNCRWMLAIFLAYQTLGLWERMVDFGKRLPKQLRRSAKVRTQLGLALNRLKRRDEAIATLQDVLHEHGPDSEVLGILGRVYKDAWFDATANGNTEAPAYLDKSIECYMRGFEADRRDPYPGINAVTLLDIRGDQESLNAKARILPMVRMAVMDRLKSAKRPEYWDY